jgi:hypothetical protein
MMKMASELVEYIDHVLQSLNADYDYIYDRTRLVRDNVSEDTRNRLDWQLAHMHKDLSMFLVDLKRHQEALQKDIDAGTTIQD